MRWTMLGSRENSAIASRSHERRRGRTPEDPLADALAAYCDRLAADITKPHDELDQAVDPALVSDWNLIAHSSSVIVR